MNDALIEGFAYDLWANLQWIEPIESLSEHRESAKRLLMHVVQAQRTWLAHCIGGEATAELPADVVEAMRTMNAEWLDFLSTSDGDAFVSYQTRSGQSHFNTVRQIAQQVLYHGMYHRGQLRGLAQSEGFEDTPETDLIIYYWNTK